LAQVRRRSCGANLSMLARAAADRTTSQSTFGDIPLPHTRPALLIARGANLSVVAQPNFEDGTPCIKNLHPPASSATSCQRRRDFSGLHFDAGTTDTARLSRRLYARFRSEPRTVNAVQVQRRWH